MRIAVVGSKGQLGTDLLKTLKPENEVMGLTHQEIEVADYSSCLKLKEYTPEVVINTAAFHKTDLCEDEPLKTFATNAIGARNIATVSKEIDAATVYISTDFVFDGSKNEPYTEDDTPNPINTYGISKLAGELYTRQNPKHYIARVASLFGIAGASGKGGNFVETMISKAKNGEQISVVDDMWMSPTYTRDAAKAIQGMLASKLAYGIYHTTNQGFCTWYQFTQEILEQTSLTANLTSTRTEDLKAKAKRPRYSALASTKLPRHGMALPNWKESLRSYLTERGHISK